MKYLALAAGVLMVAGAFAYGVREELPRVLYERVEVPVEVITEVEPDTVVQWREKIVYRTVTPTQVADAPEGAVRDVDAFCGGAGFVRPDSLPAGELPSPRLLLRSGRKDGSRYVLTGPVNDGTLRQITLDGIRGDYQWRVVGDSVLMQSDRWWWVGDALRLGAALGAGYLAGSLTN